MQISWPTVAASGNFHFSFGQHLVNGMLWADPKKLLNRAVVLGVGNLKFDW